MQGPGRVIFSMRGIVVCLNGAGNGSVEGKIVIEGEMTITEAKYMSRREGSEFRAQVEKLALGRSRESLSFEKEGKTHYICIGISSHAELVVDNKDVLF